MISKNKKVLFKRPPSSAYSKKKKVKVLTFIRNFNK